MPEHERRELAKTTADPVEQEALADDTSRSVRHILASNEKISKRVALHLSEDESREVQYAVYDNKKAPRSIRYAIMSPRR